MRILSLAIKRIFTYLEQCLFLKGKVESAIVLADMANVDKGYLCRLKSFKFNPPFSVIQGTKIARILMLNCQIPVYIQMKLFGGILPKFFDSRIEVFTGGMRKKDFRRLEIHTRQVEKGLGGESKNLLFNNRYSKFW